MNNIFKIGVMVVIIQKFEIDSGLTFPNIQRHVGSFGTSRKHKTFAEPKTKTVIKRVGEPACTPRARDHFPVGDPRKTNTYL